jgi:hypothetical protein
MPTIAAALYSDECALSAKTVMETPPKPCWATECSVLRVQRMPNSRPQAIKFRNHESDHRGSRQKNEPRPSTFEAVAPDVKVLPWKSSGILVRLNRSNSMDNVRFSIAAVTEYPFRFD